MIKAPDQLTAANWFKSTYSANNNECVEVADLDVSIGIRDSKTTSGPVMVVGISAFTALIGGLRAGAL